MSKIDDAYAEGFSRGWTQGAKNERVRIIRIIDAIKKKYPSNHTLKGGSTYGIGPLDEIEERIYEERP